MLPSIGCRAARGRQAGGELPVAVAGLAFERLPAGRKACDLQWLAVGAAVHGNDAAVGACDDAPVRRARDRIRRQLAQMTTNRWMAGIAQQIPQAQPTTGLLAARISYRGSRRGELVEIVSRDGSRSIASRYRYDARGRRVERRIRVRESESFAMKVQRVARPRGNPMNHNSWCSDDEPCREP